MVNHFMNYMNRLLSLNKLVPSRIRQELLLLSFATQFTARTVAAEATFVSGAFARFHTTVL